MTRALCSRTSKRKPVKTGKSSQESIPEEYNENSPVVLSQSSVKKLVAVRSTTSICKENILSDGKRLSLAKSYNSSKEHSSPVRKSVRRLKLTENKLKEFYKSTPDRSVLCDKTNSTASRQNKSNSTTLDILRTNENKNKVEYKLFTIPKPAVEKVKSSSYLAKYDKENHVPIYKTTDTGEIAPVNKTSLAKKEAVYEFEIDENEEPAQKKKRKKRVYTRKPKIGPKALTINNIKYGSSESLVSLPEKHVPQKNTLNSNLKAYTSVTNLNDSEDTCYSVKSFMSHPPSLFPRRNKNDLSILHETESEQCQSPINHVDDNLLSFSSNIKDSYTVNPSAATLKTVEPSFSHNVHFSPNPRCYTSKRNCSANGSFDLHDIPYQISGSSQNSPHQVSSCSTNKSSLSRDFLSSTPCKRSSLVVCNNSVFDNSCDLPQGLRPSTGFIKDSFIRNETNITDNCFGFDEPEELEEPLVSPIKNNVNIDLKLRPKFPVRDLQTKLIEKPSIKEVIEMLKATIPKAVPKKPSEVFDSSPKSSASSSPSQDNGIRVHYRKPPRRSYERQRRIRHNSEREEESDKEESEKEESDKENNKKEVAPKPMKKCYKKINAKTAKPPKVPKAKLRNAKEEEEMERLAAQMNAQFQKIEQINLVVE